MRHLYNDEEYFGFLDRIVETQDPEEGLMHVALINEYQNLRPEEAKAVCNDWKLARRCKIADERNKTNVSPYKGK